MAQGECTRCSMIESDHEHMLAGNAAPLWQEVLRLAPWQSVGAAGCAAFESVNGSPRRGNPGGSIRRRVWQHILLQDHKFGVSQLYLVSFSAWTFAAV
jgi:hypothetical protein